MDLPKPGYDYTAISTVFFCHDGKGNLFLSKRSMKVRDEQGAWEPGSGGLDFGLSAEQNVRKELMEEYGAEAKRIDFIGYSDVFRPGREGISTHWLALHFAVLVDPATLRNNEPENIDATAWHRLDSLPLPLHSQFLPFLEKYGQRLSELMQSS